MKGKKAILMTITALLLSALFFVVFSKESSIPVYYSSQPIKTRVLVLDEYVKTIPKIAGDSLDISTRDALNSLYIDYSKSGVFPSEQLFYQNLKNCIICGKKDSCQAGLSDCVAMNSTDMMSILSLVANLSYNHLNVNTDFKIYNLYVSQNYPFDVDVVIDLEYNVYDSYLDITWKRRDNISKVVSIIGLKDPLTGINTMNMFEKQVIPSDICAYNETCWNFVNAQKFFEEQTFTYSPVGTSFLSRYWNSTNPSTCCGIESFVNISDSRNISFLDHYYFSGRYYCTGIAIPGEKKILSYPSISSYFKLDEYTAGRYGMSDQGIVMCG
ncbi:MAG: hypothetical protein KatS3mg002_0734 [Candidatus Woesearchaeota archaeon]|nr:MAG: hypothetical protein KatS3mg002_0734 [Candidatus Woesearchaeota archaeon]